MNYKFNQGTSDQSKYHHINDLQGWTSINDSIMGGNSFAKCTLLENGLQLEGNLIEEGGGFVSCCSPVFSPPLDLSIYRGLHLSVDGGGRTLKIALYSNGGILQSNQFLYAGLHWVAEFSTNSSETSYIKIPFSNFKPTIRAKRIPLPLRFNLKAINQIQLLHSKFGSPGELNSGFRQGHIKILLRSISGFN